jgi:hypothetical protein
MRRPTELSSWWSATPLAEWACVASAPWTVIAPASMGPALPSTSSRRRPHLAGIIAGRPGRFRALATWTMEAQMWAHRVTGDARDDNGLTSSTCRSRRWGWRRSRKRRRLAIGRGSRCRAAWHCGGTRPPVDSGWVGLSQQIGQTGKTVRPEFYVALGYRAKPSIASGSRRQGRSSPSTPTRIRRLPGSRT